jgi:RimJ/RimL family protein N-acetyltransferase
VVRTARLVLRPFTDMDRVPFAALNAHPAVVELLGSTSSRAESDAMIDRFRAEMRREGWGFWAVEETGGAPFIGMVGLHRMSPVMPIAPGIEIGWRLHPDHWSQGYATEAARAALDFGFGQAGLDEIVAFTTTVNVRSQSVMARIGMRRDPDGDFDHPLLPDGSPLRRHVLYRISAPATASTSASPPSQAGSRVAP